MYTKYFSLKYKPFELVPNPDFLFQSSTHKKAVTYLDYGIKEKIGFILLTGEIGSGKTTIIRNLVKNLNDHSIKLSRIYNTKVSSEQLISMINEDFGLEVEGKSKTKLLSELNEFLIDQYSRKSQSILLIDEAQNLSPDLLEEIRLLSNLETDRAKLLQIILVGQPELKKTLMLPELMQLRQRINISYHITPLTPDETVKYIIHRLTIAGNPDIMKFQEDMADNIYRFSMGIPRLINVLCDFALLTTFTEGEKEVSADTVREVARDLESRDNWAGPQGNTDLASVREDEGPGLLKEVGSIARRLDALEEIIRKNIQDTEILSRKVVQMEECSAGMVGAGELNSIKEVSGRESTLEFMDSLKSALIFQLEKDKKLSVKQVKHLKKSLSDIDEILDKL